MSRDFTHQGWLSMVEVTGPFLSLPVLRSTWPSLDSINKRERERLRVAHAAWQTGGPARDWIEYVLRDLLRWGDDLHTEELSALTVDVPEHETTLAPSFALAAPGEAPKPDTTRLIGMISDGHPTARIAGSAWAATPVDRVARLCRYHDAELGLVTDGRWWALVWAPRRGTTTTALFDAVPWPEAAERDVVRAFVSLLNADRFFGVPEGQRLPALLEASKESAEDITEALGVQVRQAVELLVAAIGRAGVSSDVAAHEVYRGAVSVMMRLVFLLFAEERGLLPADNEVYAAAYSAGRLCAELEQAAIDGSEEELENTYDAWHRLLALFHAVYRGVDHRRLTMHAHDGSLFDPDEHAWMPLTIDDRTVLHMLKAVQYVEIGTGRNRERRRLSFRSLDVEQIGYVYEGLLSYEGYRAADVVVGLVGKPGREEEVELAHLERLAAASEDLLAALASEYRDSGIGSVKALAKRLAPVDEAGGLEATRRLLAVTDGDAALAERLRPFYGIIRTDLRGLPFVIKPGSLYVTESALRKNTGTHYTPRELAEQIVEGALEPLLYHVGPLQTAAREEWVHKSSEELLSLKVADIAMGSAAFLVAAARYLGDALVDAWAREGRAEALAYRSQSDDRTADADADPVVIEARRQVIEHCLYGADINEMAVEMAKLSLWLISMDPARPFTFVDDRLVVGDSLLGVASLEQLEYLHMAPAAGRRIHSDLFDWTAGVRSKVAEVASLRSRIGEVELGDDPLRALGRKRGLLAEAEMASGQLRLFADLAVGAALAHAGGGERALKAGSIEAARLANEVANGQSEPEARETTKRWLATDHVDGSFDRRPIHWPLVVPEVFDEARPNGPGFDAIVGNPPFLGGKKISGATGSAYREFLVAALAHDVKGNADLIAYFVLRAHELLNKNGQTGLIATNTLAQGDTREVGLDQIVASGNSIRQSIKSRPWPSKSAVLEYCAIWTSRAPIGEGAERRADDAAVRTITPSLNPESRATGNPFRLIANHGIAFQGSIILGMGFTVDRLDAAAMIKSDPRNKDVLFPYLGGRDLSARPDCSASRWVINFHDWSEERARTYPGAYGRIRRLVKPERAAKSDQIKSVPWWWYWNRRPALIDASSGLERLIVITRHASTVMPVVVSTGQVFSEALVVFAIDDTAMLTLLSSAPHYWWARSRGSSLKTDLRYTPSDVFETLPLPELSTGMRELGDRLDTYRRDVMLSRNAGLTATYNLVHDPMCDDEDIAELRRIHALIDKAVCRAYGWDDLIDQLAHDHYDLGRETRYTVAKAIRIELCDRLLELNHERYAEEKARGLHDKKGGKRGGRANRSQGEHVQGTIL